MRINKYLAQQKIASRREADKLIEAGKVFINGTRANLGDKVEDADKVEVKGLDKKYVYYAFHKPVGVITHSPQEDEIDIEEYLGRSGGPRKVFPLGRLDKASHGLIILTNDGRITEKLLSPEYKHEKEYLVTTKKQLDSSFMRKLSSGVELEDFTTRKCKAEALDSKTFKIILTEGKKHQIRRMVQALGNEVVDLKRVRIMNINLGNLKEGQVRKITEDELDRFLDQVL